MKKIILLICVLFIFSLSGINAAQFSLSEHGVDMKGNIERRGTNLILKYKLDGMNNLQGMPNVSEENLQAVRALSTIDMAVEASCVQPKIRILSIKMSTPDGGTIDIPSQTDWLPLEKQEDIQSIKELCKQY